MTINHKFVSQKEDVTDDSLVRPSDWNDDLVGSLNLSNSSNSTTDVAITGILPTAFGGTGFSTYLTDEAGVNLTDESNVPLEGKEATAMDYSISPFTKGSVLFVTTGGRITEDNTNFTWNANTYSLSITGNFVATGTVTGSNLSGTNTGDQTTSGTTDRITVTSGATNPVIDIASTYVGQTSINTLGIIGTGSWQANTIGVAYGGTGIATYTIGDILYASAGTTLSKLTGVATGNALISGGVATAPSWGKIGLTTHVSGTLPVANGGTGQTSYTNGQLLIGNTTGNTLDKATLTAGEGIDITNGSGSITVAQALDDTKDLSFSDSPYTVLTTDRVLNVDATSGNVTLNLYAISGNEGRWLEIRKSDSSSNTITLDGNGAETINGAATLVISSQYAVEKVRVLSSEWGRF